MNILILHPRDLLSEVAATPSDVEHCPSAPAPRVGRAEIVDERLTHLRKVLRVAEGDQVRVGILNGPVGTATIEAIERHRAELTFECAEPPPARLEVDLLLALPRPKFLGRILQNAASMGVRSIRLFQSGRVEKSYWRSRLFDEGAMERHLLLGLEQGRDTRLPELSHLRDFREVVRWVQDALERGTGSWLADGEGSEAFPRSASTDAALIIGPEGGFLDEEIDQLVGAGARRATLGTRPLRVETAVSVCLGRLMPDAKPPEVP